MHEIDDAWVQLCDRLEARGYPGLSKNEKIWLNVRTLIDSVQSGGLISYFYNSGADTLPDCLEAISELGFESIVQQVERAMALFPDGVPSDIDARNEVIDSWPDDGVVDELLQEIDDDLSRLIEGLENSLAVFVEQSGLL